jgi:hypothetical protein
MIQKLHTKPLPQFPTNGASQNPHYKIQANVSIAFLIKLPKPPLICLKRAIVIVSRCQTSTHPESKLTVRLLPYLRSRPTQGSSNIAYKVFLLALLQAQRFPSCSRPPKVIIRDDALKLSHCASLFFMRNKLQVLRSWYDLGSESARDIIGNRAIIHHVF